MFAKHVSMHVKQLN